MASIKFDTSQVTRLALDLSKAPGRIQRSAPKVLEVAANKIKRGMKDDASGHGHLPALDRHVSYTKESALSYEIGFDKVGQGNLANIAAFGSVNNAPVMDHAAALRRETPVMLSKLGQAAEDSVLAGDE